MIADYFTVATRTPSIEESAHTSFLNARAQQLSQIVNYQVMAEQALVKVTVGQYEIHMSDSDMSSLLSHYIENNQQNSADYKLFTMAVHYLRSTNAPPKPRAAHRR